jgi:hypothetical protein
MQYLRDGAEEGNIRGLVESCAHNDDVTPLVKLVFEAQALADTTPSIVGKPHTSSSLCQHVSTLHTHLHTTLPAVLPACS